MCLQWNKYHDKAVSQSQKQQCIIAVSLLERARYNYRQLQTICWMWCRSSHIFQLDSGCLPIKSSIQDTGPSIYLQVCCRFAFVTLFSIIKIVSCQKLYPQKINQKKRINHARLKKTVTEVINQVKANRPFAVAQLLCHIISAALTFSKAKPSNTNIILFWCKRHTQNIFKKGGK